MQDSNQHIMSNSGKKISYKNQLGRQKNYILIVKTKNGIINVLLCHKRHIKGGKHGNLKRLCNKN